MRKPKAETGFISTLRFRSVLLKSWDFFILDFLSFVFSAGEVDYRQFRVLFLGIIYSTLASLST